MGRGTPVPAKVLLCSRGVKNAVLGGNKHGDQRSEVGGQKSEKTDDRGQFVSCPWSVVRWGKAENWDWRMEVGRQNGDLKSRRQEIGVRSQEKNN